MLSIILIILIIKFKNQIIFVHIDFVIFIFILAIVWKITGILNHIVISDNKIKVYDFPFSVTRNYYIKKYALTSYNSEIYLDEIVNIEIIKLTRKEQKNI